MYILVNEDNVVKHISEDLARQEITNYYLVDKGMLAIPTQFIKNVYEVQEIPEEVEIEKYCFNDTEGFYENENYVEPKSESQTIEELRNQLSDQQEQITNLELALAELVEGGEI